MKSVLVAIFACFAVPVAAQSSLGISGAQVSLGVVEDESGHSRTEFGALVDVAITGVHGFQGDLRFDDTQAGGVGTLEHMAEGIRKGHADAVLAASIFHFGEHTVAEAKQVLATSGIEVRW